MRTKEFKEKLKELNLYLAEEHVIYPYYTSSGKEQLYVTDEDEIEVYGVVSKTEVFKFSTNYKDFDDLSIDKKNLLTEVLLSYSKTPIEEREEEKKYYLILTCLPKYKGYLNLSTRPTNKHNRGEIFFGCKNSNTYQIEFTSSEIDQFSYLIQDLIRTGNLIKVEVQAHNKALVKGYEDNE